MTGIAHHWDQARRFGKVTGVDRREYFCHVDELVDVLHLAPGQRVEFAPSQTARGRIRSICMPSTARRGWSGA